VVLGGTGSLIGAVLAGLAMPYVSESLTAWADISPVIFGALIVLVMLFAPSGLAGLWQRLVDLVVPVRLRRPGDAHMTPLDLDRASLIADLRPYFEGSPATGGDLVAQGVEKRFGGVVAVRHVNLRIEAGEIHGIIGPNGAGKSSLYNILTGVTPPDAGTVTFAGKDVTKARPQQCAAVGVVRTFQNGRLFDTMSVYENVLTVVGPNPGLPSLSLLVRPIRAGREEHRAAEIARLLVALVGLEEHADTNVQELAYGQRRLVEIARALAARPRILLLDEPAAGLAAGDRLALIALLRTLQSEFDMSIGIVEHDLDLIGTVCDRVTVLHEGQDIATETPQEVLRDPEVRAAYMGRAAAEDVGPGVKVEGGTA
jgi:branched-chain amino acid transport system permease protein